MKKHLFSNRMAAAIIGIVAITSISVGTPSVAQPKEEKPATTADPNAQETSQLVQQLIKDRLISEVKGFTVIKSNDQLFINGKLQPAAVSTKYFSNIKQKDISIQVYPFAERLKMHPDANILQLVMPATFSSPCVASKPKGDGC